MKSPAFFYSLFPRNDIRFKGSMFLSSSVIASLRPAEFVFCHSQLVFYLFPLALLCVLHNIWQFSIFVLPPLLHAVTWSASISLNL